MDGPNKIYYSSLVYIILVPRRRALPRWSYRDLGFFLQGTIGTTLLSHMKMGNRREGKSSWIIPYFLKKKETCWPSPRQGKLAVKAEKNPEGEFSRDFIFRSIIKGRRPGTFGFSIGLLQYDFETENRTGRDC